MIVAGIGCRSACTAATIVDLVRAAEAKAGCVAGAVAIPHFKADEPGAIEAAALLGVALILVDAAAMAAMQEFCMTHSNVVMLHTGLASVAEAAALAAAGPGAVLLLPRLAVADATCAIAEGPRP
jgi:cobalt-precorrin 5A hydrolase